MKLIPLFALLVLAADAPAQPPFRLAPESRHRELVNLIPATDDPKLEKLVRDRRLVVLRCRCPRRPRVRTSRRPGWCRR